MNNLNLPEYSFKSKQIDNKKYIFDVCRQKYVVLTPEEWVRQHFINFLIIEKKYPKSLIAVEYSLKLNKLEKRSDIVIYNKQLKPIIIVECKAPNIKINQQVFDQIAGYNMKLNAKYLILTNGLNHYCCILDNVNMKYQFLKEIPHYEDDKV